MERHVEVGVFSDRIMFQSVSIPLQNGVCFLHDPNPCTPVWVCLTVSLSPYAAGVGERYRVSTFRTSDLSRLGSFYPPTGLCPCQGTLETLNHPLTFWFKP
jgi:hypothetical protein